MLEKSYIALLRGVNVGGKNKVSMPVLKAAFEKVGFSEVVTYINSGNIIFTGDCGDKETLAKKCSAIIADKFGLDIAVAIVSAEELSDALQNAPPWWDNNIMSKHNAIFVIRPATTEEIIMQIGATKPEYEQIGVWGQVIFWSAPKETFNKTRLTKVVTTSACNNITIRNANTTKKLLQLVK